MPAPSPIREFLQALGQAVLTEMWRLYDERSKYPLRKNSQLKRTARVQVNQARDAGGRFAGYTANSSLTLLAEEYLVYLDSGRKPGGKKVPISALLTFIKNRNLRGRDKKSGRFLESNRLAWMIQASIFRHGIRGKHMIAPALEHGNELLDIYLNNDLLDSITLDFERTFQFL